MCNPVHFPLVAPAVKAMLSLRQRQTLTIHSGSSNSLLESLAACSLPASVIPDNMGGSLHVSLEEQVAARLAVEGQRDSIITSEVNRRNLSQDGNISDVTSFDGDLVNAFMGLEEGMASESKPSFLPPTSSSSAYLNACFGPSEMRNITDFSTVTESESTVKPTSSKKSPQVGKGNIVHTTEVNPSKKCSALELDSKPSSLPQNAASSHTTKVEGKGKIMIRVHPGRTGDKRMNKAFDAKKQNPKMSHLDAILAGGFVFPNMYAPGVKLGDAKDLDGVSVNQRKNQLMRRLRTDNAKKKKMKAMAKPAI